MPVTVLFSVAAKRDSMQHDHAVSDHRGLAYHHTGCMVHKHTLAKTCGGVNVDPKLLRNVTLNVLGETNEPAEDFVVLCNKTQSHLFAIGENVREIVVDKVIVTKSGVEVDCGLMLGGTNGSVSIMHPVFTIDKENGYKKEGISYIAMKSVLSYPDEQKTKYKSGYWDKYKNPSIEYARSFGSCGFGFYLDSYSKEKRIDKKYFFNKYNDILLECNKEIYKEVLKHNLTISERSFNVDKTMERIWSPNRWNKYN